MLKNLSLVHLHLLGVFIRQNIHSLTIININFLVEFKQAPINEFSVTAFVARVSVVSAAFSRPLISLKVARLSGFIITPSKEMRYFTKDPKILSLIHRVRTHPVLYDHRLPGHMDETLKEETWKSIAAACDMSSVEATMCWKNLYSCFMGFYRNELIRLIRANYTENEIGPIPPEYTPLKDGFFMNRTWGYYSDMGFIAPFRIRGADPELDRLIELAKPLVCKEANKSSLVTDSINANCAPRSERVISKIESNSSMPLLGMDIPPIEMTSLKQDDLCLRSFFDSLYRSTRVLPKHLQRRVKAEMLQSLNCAEAENDESAIAE